MKNKYTPKAEIDQRIQRLQNSLAQADIEAALVVCKTDYFYFSGTAQSALLFVRQKGAPLLMVFRDIDRAREESTIDHIVSLESLDFLPQTLHHHYGNLPARIGIEFDMVAGSGLFPLSSAFS